MTKIQALKAIEAAGIDNDSTAMVRIYTENRIGYAKALEAWTRGCRMRHAKKAG